MKKIVESIVHQVRLAKSLHREKQKESTRSSKWASVRDHFLKENPSCAACGGTKHIQVHHKKPFHEFPELELEMSNLISLCMGNNECHLLLGHGGDYHHYNPNVEKDALEFSKKTDKRPSIIASARSKRLENG